MPVPASQYGDGRHWKLRSSRRRTFHDNDRSQARPGTLPRPLRARSACWTGAIGIQSDTHNDRAGQGGQVAHPCGTPTRSPALPNVPTIGEFVAGYEASVWNGVVAPKDTPAAIIDKLHEAIDAALADPKLMTQFAGIGSVPKSMTPADLGKFIAEDTEKWAKVIRAANIKAE